LESADSAMREQYTLAIWNSCLFGRQSVKSHPEWLALVSGFRLNGAKLDVNISHMLQSILFNEISLIELLPARCTDGGYQLQ
jgi:hypothetical protein